MATELEIIVDGQPRRLGNNSMLSIDGGVFKLKGVNTRLFGEDGTPTAKLIPRSQWKPVNLRRFAPPTKDQNGVGACNAFSTVNLIEGCRAMHSLKPITLHPGYLYGNINGGRDQGSLLEDALDWVLRKGVPRFDGTGKQYDWRLHSGRDEDAACFRVREAFLCPTFDHLASAIQQGFLLSLGVMWANSDTPDADGWLPRTYRGQAGGHAIAGFELAERGGVWGLGFENSWGARWGRNGGAILPESRFSVGSVGGWWAIRDIVVYEPLDSMPEPKGLIA